MRITLYHDPNGSTVTAVDALATALPIALITSVDSIPNVTSVDALMDAGARPLGPAAVIPTGQLLEADILGAGFDEVYLVERQPSGPPPKAGALVCPVDVRSDTLPQVLVDWMESAGPVVGFGDGCGLNAAWFGIPGRARELLAAYLKS